MRHIASPEEFRAYVREVLPTVGPDPGDVAGKVLAEVDDASCRVIAEVTLRGWVRNFAAFVAREQTDAATDDEPADDEVDWDDASTGDGAGSSSDPGPGIDTSHSRRVSAIRAWHARMLASSLFTGTTWKFLGTCTADDLESAAAYKFTKAKETAAAAEREHARAVMMKQRGYATVEDVPLDVFAAYWERG